MYSAPSQNSEPCVKWLIAYEWFNRDPATLGIRYKPPYPRGTGNGPLRFTCYHVCNITICQPYTMLSGGLVHIPYDDVNKTMRSIFVGQVQHIILVSPTIEETASPCSIRRWHVTRGSRFDCNWDVRSRQGMGWTGLLPTNGFAYYRDWRPAREYGFLDVMMTCHV